MNPEVLELIKNIPEHRRLDTLGFFAQTAHLESVIGGNLSQKLIHKFAHHEVNERYFEKFASIESDIEKYVLSELLWESQGFGGKNPYSDIDDVNVKEFWEYFSKLPRYTYHGCASGNLEKIGKEGLQPLRIFTNPDTQQPLNDFASRFPTMFSWGSFQKEQAYTSDYFGTAIDYGYRSPEWFSGVSGGNMYYLELAGYDYSILELLRTAYPLRHKAGCRNNIDLFCKTYNITTDDRDFLEQLFESTWEANFPDANIDTNVVVIKDDLEQNFSTFDNRYHKATRNGVIDINSMIWLRGYDDIDRRHERINIEEIEGVVRIPEYKLIFPEKNKRYEQFRS